MTFCSWTRSSEAERTTHNRRVGISKLPGSTTFQETIVDIAEMGYREVRANPYEDRLSDFSQNHASVAQW